MSPRKQPGLRGELNIKKQFAFTPFPTELLSCGNICAWAKKEIQFTDTAFRTKRHTYTVHGRDVRENNDKTGRTARRVRAHVHTFRTGRLLFLSRPVYIMYYYVITIV